MASGDSGPTRAAAAHPARAYRGSTARVLARLFEGANRRPLAQTVGRLLARHHPQRSTNMSWRAMLSHSRRLFSNLGAVHGAMHRARPARGRPGLAAVSTPVQNHAWGVKAATAWLIAVDEGLRRARRSLRFPHGSEAHVHRAGPRRRFRRGQPGQRQPAPGRTSSSSPAHRIASRNVRSTTRCITSWTRTKGCWIRRTGRSQQRRGAHPCAATSSGPQRGMDNGFASGSSDFSTFDMHRTSTGPSGSTAGPWPAEPLQRAIKRPAPHVRPARHGTGRRGGAGHEDDHRRERHGRGS